MTTVLYCRERPEESHLRVCMNMVLHTPSPYKTEQRGGLINDIRDTDTEYHRS